MMLDVGVWKRPTLQRRCFDVVIVVWMDRSLGNFIIEDYLLFFKQR